MNAKENVWQIQEAKAKFSQLVEDASKKGHQLITKMGKPVAVLLSLREFEKMSSPENSLLEFFREAPLQEVELDLTRSKETMRDIEI